jgi:hypothetical protein
VRVLQVSPLSELIFDKKGFDLRKTGGICLQHCLAARTKVVLGNDGLRLLGE